MRPTACWLVGLLLLVTGCMGGPNVETVTVQGKLLRDGQPLAGKSSGGGAEGPPAYDGYQLTFYANGVNEGSTQVDENGQFSVDLPPGKKYKVIVTRVKESFGPPTSQPPRGNVPILPVQQDEMLKKFSSLESTPIEIEVGSGNTEVTLDLAKY